MPETSTVRAAARERSFRTLVQGAGVDVVVALAVWILANINSVDVSSRAAVIAVLVSVAKTILTALASYVMRLKVKPSEETVTKL